MVPTPPQEERDHRSPEYVKVNTSTTGSDKDKGKIVTNAQTNANAREGCSGTRKEEILNQGTRRMGQCVPKSNTVPRLQIKSDRIREEIQYMKERALIGKFVGIWPTEKMLVGWINSTWKPQGHYDL